MDEFLAGFRRLFSWFVKLEIAASVGALAAICVLTLAVIVGREVMNTSILWAEEISLLMMKIVVFEGAAGMYALRAYIVVDGLTDTFPVRARSWVHLFGWLVIGGFATTVAWQGLMTYPSQIAVRTYLLELPKFYFMVPLIVGAASIVITSIYYALATFCSIRSGKDVGTPDGIPAFAGFGQVQ